MNGYSCPCCGGFIAKDGPFLRRCPTCSASAETQRIAIQRRQAKDATHD